MNKSQNLQDNFLNQVRKDNIPVTIYLVSGVQLKGHVRGFDSFTVLLESQGKPTQLVYKHAMASVVPARFVSTAPPKEESKAESVEATSEAVSGTGELATEQYEAVESGVHAEE